jgi:hypothetical protein
VGTLTGGVIEVDDGFGSVRRFGDLRAPVTYGQEGNVRYGQHIKGDTAARRCSLPARKKRGARLAASR